MRFSVKLKLASAFAAVIALSVVSGGVALTKLEALNENVDEMAQTDMKRFDYAASLSIELLRVVRAEKNMILSTTDQDIDRFAAEILKQREIVKKAREQS